VAMVVDTNIDLPSCHWVVAGHGLESSRLVLVRLAEAEQQAAEERSRRDK
jgi:hypothetical protein